MKVVIFVLGCVLSANAFSADIAACSEPSGKGYFPAVGLVQKKDSGWSDERISGGITKVTKLADGTYDILYVDATKNIYSSRDGGAEVLLLNRGRDVFSILVVYLGTTAEIYTFLKDNSGKLEYVHAISKGGDGVLITKASVMRGDCSYINFDAL